MNKGTHKIKAMAISILEADNLSYKDHPGQIIHLILRKENVVELRKYMYAMATIFKVLKNL